MPIPKRPPFTHDGEYVYCRPLMVSGDTVSPGDRVDNSQFNTRRLRQLYDQRKIQYADADGPKERSYPPQVGENKPNLGPRVDVPSDWRDLHWKVRQKIAEEIAGIRPRNGKAANAIIEDYVS